MSADLRPRHEPGKAELFDRLALHLTTLADQVELAMIEAVKSAKGYPACGG